MSVINFCKNDLNFFLSNTNERLLRKFFVDVTNQIRIPYCDKRLKIKLTVSLANV